MIKHTCKSWNICFSLCDIFLKYDLNNEPPVDQVRQAVLSLVFYSGQIKLNYQPIIYSRLSVSSCDVRIAGLQSGIFLPLFINKGTSFSAMSM